MRIVGIIWRTGKVRRIICRLFNGLVLFGGLFSEELRVPDSGIKGDDGSDLIDFGWGTSTVLI